MNRSAMVLLLFVAIFCGCSSQSRYQQINHPPFTFDTKAGLDCWAKVSSPEREKARAAWGKMEAARSADPGNTFAGLGYLDADNHEYNPKDYPYCSDLK
jgi:hypothetical protein